MPRIGQPFQLMTWQRNTVPDGRVLRTVIVLTRLAEDRVVATYVNVEPPYDGVYLISIETNPTTPDVNGRPVLPVGTGPSDLPPVGGTRTIVKYEGDR